MPICLECLHKQSDRILCNNTDLPVTDFVHGGRYCPDLTLKGECKGFKPIPQSESIYELKSDEDLAKT